jgi:hypothetical protein
MACSPILKRGDLAELVTQRAHLQGVELLSFHAAYGQ